MKYVDNQLDLLWENEKFFEWKKDIQLSQIIFYDLLLNENNNEKDHYYANNNIKKMFQITHNKNIYILSS